MEIIYSPSFVTEKAKDPALNRLQLLSVLARRLETSQVVEADITVPIMKVLAYLRPLPGVTYLNDLQEKLKDLVFHLHNKCGKNDTVASMDLSEAKSEFFPKDMSDDFKKMLHLQQLFIKEHRMLVNLYEQYAHDLYKQRNSKCIEDIVTSKRASLRDRELVVRAQLQSLSIQLAIQIEEHIASVASGLVYNLRKQAYFSDAPSVILESLLATRPGLVAHEMYLAMADKYIYPAKPESLIYCPDTKSYNVSACPPSNEAQSVPDMINTNMNASTFNLASNQKELYKTTITNYNPQKGWGLPLKKGETVKTKLESADGRWRFGWKRRALGLKKTWGFFPTDVLSK